MAGEARFADDEHNRARAFCWLDGKESRPLAGGTINATVLLFMAPGLVRWYFGTRGMGLEPRRLFRRWGCLCRRTAPELRDCGVGCFTGLRLFSGGPCHGRHGTF